MYSIGFVGTDDHLTSSQTATIRDLLTSHRPRYIHHGDCLGSGADVHMLALRTTARIVAHPAKDEARRAHLNAHLVLEPVGLLSRFRSIVSCSELLLVAIPPSTYPLHRNMVDLVNRAPMRDTAFVVIAPDGHRTPGRGRRSRKVIGRWLSLLQQRFRLK